MKLYCGIGPNSYRVRIFMAEKGIDVPRVDVDLTKGEHKSPQFLELNSLGQIPVLVLDDGTVITESIAICRYLEALHPTPALFGSDAVSQGKVEMWNRRAEIEIFGTIGSIALHSDPMFAERLVQFPAFAETQREAVPAKWAWLDREIADGRPFIAGDQYSVADITAAVAAWLGAFFGADIPDSLVNVHHWLDRVQKRPSWNA
ncbi:MAG: glutathione S-transferase family protein [Mesorhizobium sp.]|uniref:glutathione S-transferase family protein n=1 Tax=Mesorhizobium sp. TaxID=1871066 RepID=UPI001208D202|nr:glutathione S-transferase family protein [Mesorhizobium sp.]TIM29549.1 MAG: glutathione S-transferase family protein [Mesorhizobium sp.]